MPFLCDLVDVFCIVYCVYFFFFFFSSRRRHTRSYGDWSSDVCSSDLMGKGGLEAVAVTEFDEPQAVIGSRLHELAYPDYYRQHFAHGGELTEFHEIGRASCRERV